MIVKELIKELQTRNPDAPVFCASDAEGNKITEFYCTSQERLMGEDGDYYGADEEEDDTSFEAVILWPE